MVYSLRFFFSSECSLFHNSNVFVSCIIHILYTCRAKIKKKIIPAPRGCHRRFCVKFALLGVIILHGFNFKEFVSITFRIKMVFYISTQVSDLECYLNIVWAGIAQSVKRLATC